MVAHRLYRVPGFLASRPNWVSLHFLPRKRVRGLLCKPRFLGRSYHTDPLQTTDLNPWTKKERSMEFKIIRPITLRGPRGKIRGLPQVTQHSMDPEGRSMDCWETRLVVIHRLGGKSMEWGPNSDKGGTETLVLYVYSKSLYVVTIP